MRSFLLILLSCFMGAAAAFAKPSPPVEYTKLGKVYTAAAAPDSLRISRVVDAGNIRNSAIKGNMASVYSLGLLMQNQGNFAGAFLEHAKACEQGSIPEACNNAGFIKINGLDSPDRANKDFAMGLFYLFKARDMGDIFAAYNLSRHYFEHKPRNYLLSYLHGEIAYRNFKGTDQVVANSLKSRAFQRISKLEDMYQKAYVPDFLERFMNDADRKKKKVIPGFPMPPLGGVIKDNEELFLAFDKGLSAMGESETKRKGQPAMLEWKPMAAEKYTLPEKLIAPDLSSDETATALIYRYNAPTRIKITFAASQSIIPMVLGDEVFVYLYSPGDEGDEIWKFDTPSGVLDTSRTQSKRGGFEVYSLRPSKKGEVMIDFINTKDRRRQRLFMWVQ